MIKIIHLSLMAVTVLLLITAVCFARYGKHGKILIHKSLALVSVCLGLGGLTTMIVFKSLKGYPHFHTPHALLGAAGFLLLLLTPIFGVLLTKGRTGLRPVHKFLGRTGILLGSIALFLGVYRILL